MFRSILLIFLLLSKLSFSQLDLQWGHGFGTSSIYQNSAGSIVLDSSGNSYTIGYFSDSADFDPSMGTYMLYANSNYCGFICKHTASGNLVWAIKYDFINLVDIAIDKSSNIYITGNFYPDSVDINPGSGVQMAFNTGKSATFVSMLNNSGGFIWAKNIDSPEYVSSRSLVADPDGLVYVLGDFRGHVDFDPGGDSTYADGIGNGSDIFIWKLTAAGNFTWVKSIGGSWDESGSQIVMDQNSNLYITGKFMTETDFDPGPGTYNLSSTLWDEIFVCKLDKDGNLIWAKQFGADGRGGSIAVDKEENVVFTGIFKNTVDFDPGPGVQYITTNGNYDVFLSKLNKDGSLNWVQQFGNDPANAHFSEVIVDEYSNIFVTGWCSGTADFDNSPGVCTLSSGNIFADILIMELNPSGQLIWAKNIGGVKNDIGAGIAKDCSSIYITGSYRDRVDFDPGTDTTFLPVSDSISGKAYIAKYKLIPATPLLVEASNDSVCKGEPVLFQLQGSVQPNGTSWQWYEGSCGGTSLGSGETISVIPSSSGTFFARSESGCSFSECVSVTVNVKESPDASASVITKADCSGVLVNCKNESVNADSYVWSFNDGSSSTEVNAEHYFAYNSGFQVSLAAINDNGCKDSFNIKNSSAALDWFQLVIPNVFTPNNDGVNDELKISSEAAINNCFSLRVFNRWGNEIYSTNNMDSGWNGTVSNGQKSEPGTYFYILKVDEFEYQGSVLLLE